MRIIILFLILFYTNLFADCVQLSGTGWMSHENGNCSSTLTGQYGQCGSVVDCPTHWNSYTPCPSQKTSTWYNQLVVYTGVSQCRAPSSYNTSCNYFYRCDSQQSADSVQCILDGNIWDTSQSPPKCDDGTCDTTYNCLTYSYFHCDDIPSNGQIVCINGECSGLPYSRWYSTYESNCTNGCGQIKNDITTGDTAYTFGFTCNDEEPKCSSKTYCTEIDGNYILYKKCLVGREVVGNQDTRQEIPQIEYTAPGTCLQNGYNSEKYTKSSGGQMSGGGQQEQQSNDCLIYGIGCTEGYKDTIDYSKNENKNPQNDCVCKPFDGLGTMSQIICPDGSSTIVYMTCDEWHGIFRSSSSVGGGGVSSSTPTPTSSTSNPNTSDSFGQYPRYPTDQSQTNSNVQAALSGISGLVQTIKETIQSIKDYLTTDGQSVTFDTVPTYSHGDYSSLDSNSTIVFDSLFKVLDSNRVVIDTSVKVSSGICPILTGNFSQCKKFIPFVNNTDLNMRMDLSNLYGINLCTIIKSIIVGFASIVSFFIGFSIFGKTKV